MKLVSAFLALFALAAVPAQACVMPPDGYVEPTKQDFADAAAAMQNIVYVQIVGIEPYQQSQFGNAIVRVHHVYKGELSVGDELVLGPSYGFTFIPCPMAMAPKPGVPPQAIGHAYVVAFDERQRELRVVTDDLLDILFSQGTIQRASAS